MLKGQEMCYASAKILTLKNVNKFYHDFRTKQLTVNLSKTCEQYSEDLKGLVLRFEKLCIAPIVGPTGKHAALPSGQSTSQINCPMFVKTFEISNRSR